MRIVIAAVGRLKTGPERELVERYRKRASDLGRSVGLSALDVVEIRDSRAQAPDRRMVEESIAIANVISEGAVTVILDERGEDISSESLSGHIKAWRADNRPSAVFIIGGDHGLASTLRDKADLVLAFGRATWPHQLVRIMLLEQLYRVITILSGHPYHRGS